MEMDGILYWLDLDSTENKRNLHSRKDGVFLSSTIKQLIKKWDQPLLILSFIRTLRNGHNGQVKF
jgi:hypothetical protein